MAVEALKWSSCCKQETRLDFCFCCERGLLDSSAWSQFESTSRVAVVAVLESDMSSPVLGPAEIPYIPEQMYPFGSSKTLETLRSAMQCHREQRSAGNGIILRRCEEEPCPHSGSCCLRQGVSSSLKNFV